MERTWRRKREREQSEREREVKLELACAAYVSRGLSPGEFPPLLFLRTASIREIIKISYVFSFTALLHAPQCPPESPPAVQ